MHIVNDPARTQDLCETALGLMNDRHIPANPDNFLVWYSFVDNSNPDLSRALEELIAENVDFTAERNAEIHSKYFSQKETSEQVNGTADQIHQSVGKIVEMLAQGSSDKREFESRMMSLSEDLCGGKNAGEVNETIRSILVETQSSLKKSQELEDQLLESSKEIESLRDHLQAVRKEAMTDGLTGIANRKCFDQRLRDDAAKAVEEGTSLCLIIADIDHFKKFNDTFGHAVGDSVLKVVARNLSDGVKGQDLPARYGGEEFCIILPDTTIENAAKLAEQIRAKLAKKELKSTKTNDNYGTVTLSLGVSEYRCGEALDDFLQRADQALYRAKGLGRNKVVTETQLPEPIPLTG